MGTTASDVDIRRWDCSSGGCAYLTPIAGDAVRRVRFAFKLAPVAGAALGAFVMPGEHRGGLDGFLLGFFAH